MRRITFFRNLRFDGGERIGVTAGGVLPPEPGIVRGEPTVLHRFTPSSDLSNPALRWYLDVEFEGENLPTGPEDVRAWLSARASSVGRVLRELADELEPAGIDTEPFPLLRRLPTFEPGLTARLRMGAARAVDAKEVGGVLRDTAERFAALVAALQAKSSDRVA
jgi:hypothetical protein